MAAYTYPTDPSNAARDRLRTLITRANTATTHDQSLRIAIFGDSTWTSPGGYGLFPMHYLNRKLGQLFGNIAGSQMISLASNSGTPFVRAAGQGVQSSPLASTYDAAGVLTKGVPFTGESSYFSDIGFRPYSGEKGAQRLILAGNTLFPTANQKLEIYCSKRLNSAESLLIEYRPTDKAFSLFESILTSQQETLAVSGLDASASTYEIVRVRTTNAYNPSAGKPYPQWWIKSGVATTVGAGSKAPPLINGVRVLNANPVGAIIDTFSAGGYLTRQWFGDTVTGGGGGTHINAAGQIAQLGHDIWMFNFGTNDYYGGISAADQKRNYYDPAGANNSGMIGMLIAAAEARALPVPLIIITTPPFRADDGGGSYATYKAQHIAALAQLQALVDQLQAAGYDAILRDVKNEADALGFNAAINDFQGLTDRGAYSTSSVSYSVGDYYTGTDGYYYRCIVAHTSSATTEPTDDGANNVAIQHIPLHIHLDGTPSGSNTVHWSAIGADLIASCISNLFYEHLGPGSITLSSDTIDDIVAAIDASTTGTNAATAATQATTAATQATAAATQATAAAEEVVKVQRAATAVTAGGPQQRHLENVGGDTLQTIYEVHDGDPA